MTVANHAPVASLPTEPRTLNTRTLHWVDLVSRALLSGISMWMPGAGMSDDAAAEALSSSCNGGHCCRFRRASVHDKARAFSERQQSYQNTAVGKVQARLQCLLYPGISSFCFKSSSSSNSTPPTTASTSIPL